jgi:hypothetical protein
MRCHFSASSIQRRRSPITFCKTHSKYIITINNCLRTGAKIGPLTPWI